MLAHFSWNIAFDLNDMVPVWLTQAIWDIASNKLISKKWQKNRSSTNLVAGFTKAVTKLYRLYRQICRFYYSVRNSVF